MVTMGFTGLARWINPPPHGLELINENILRNHQGQYRGRWQLTVRSYRSTLGMIPGLHVPSERSMFSLTMGDNVFVLLEDPSAPTHLDVPSNPRGQPITLLSGPPHYRASFLTLRPPGALEQLLAQLRARWVSVRQSGQNAPQRGQTTGQQLLIDGHVFAIGTDWIVRVGNVILTGGAVKGMLLEAEYLPLPNLRSLTADGTSELLSNLLTSVLPNIRDAKTVAVTISDAQLEEVLWDREAEERGGDSDARQTKPDGDDIYIYGDEDLVTERKGDWMGLERDRRSAFLIMGALKSEGIL